MALIRCLLGIYSKGTRKCCMYTVGTYCIRMYVCVFCLHLYIYIYMVYAFIFIDMQQRSIQSRVGFNAIVGIWPPGLGGRGGTPDADGGFSRGWLASGELAGRTAAVPWSLGDSSHVVPCAG